MCIYTYDKKIESSFDQVDIHIKIQYITNKKMMRASTMSKS